MDVGNCGSARGYAEFAKEVRNMETDGLGADKQRCGNLAVGSALGQ